MITLTIIYLVSILCVWILFECIFKKDEFKDQFKIDVISISLMPIVNTLIVIIIVFTLIKYWILDKFT